MKINIREKIASLKAFGDTFEHQETRGEKQIVHLLSVFNGGKPVQKIISL